MADEKDGWLRGWVKQLWFGAASAAGGSFLVFWPAARDWAWSVISATWTHLGAKSFPNWSWYLLALISAQVLVRLAIWWMQVKDADSHECFTEARMFGVLWRWRYISGRPAHFVAFCPYCDTQLVGEYRERDPYEGSHDEISFRCDHCNSNLHREQCTPSYLEGKVRRQVERMIRSGDWRAEVANNGSGG